MPNRLNVTLTGTTNPYLAPRLPLDGELELFEIGLHSALISAVFRIRDANGNLGAPVTVAEPEFTYQHAHAQRASIKPVLPLEDTAVAPERCNCSGAGKWGATGLLPEGHHIHHTAGGFYLAHGEPSAADAARYAANVQSEYEADVAKAAARRVAQLNAAGLLAS